MDYYSFTKPTRGKHGRISDDRHSTNGVTYTHIASKCRLTEWCSQNRSYVSITPQKITNIADKRIFTLSDPQLFRNSEAGGGVTMTSKSIKNGAITSVISHGLLRIRRVHKSVGAYYILHAFS